MKDPVELSNALARRARTASDEHMSANHDGLHEDADDT